jgi:hypothetical protein
MFINSIGNFKKNWATKLPWVKSVLNDNEFVTFFRARFVEGNG